MRAFILGTLAALMALIPLVIAETTDPQWKWRLIGAFVFTVFFVHWKWVFRPDDRFDRAREAVLEHAFNYKFDRALRSLKKGERLPFRVNAMKPRFTFRGWRMKIVYSYGMKRVDADYRISLPKNHGVCWHVWETGNIGWYCREEHDSETFGLTREEDEATKDVQAILSLPLRAKDKERPHAILNFDALTQDAVEDLRAGKDSLKSHNDRELVDLATLVGLFV